MDESGYSVLIRVYKIVFGLVVMGLSIASVVLVVETQTQRFFPFTPSTPTSPRTTPTGLGVRSFNPLTSGTSVTSVTSGDAEDHESPEDSDASGASESKNTDEVDESAKKSSPSPSPPPRPRPTSASAHLPFGETDNDWRATGCTLNVHATGVCTYAITLGAFGIALALAGIAFASLDLYLELRIPYPVDLGLHLFGALWWYTGCVILGVYLQRAARIARIANPSRSIRTGFHSSFDSMGRGDAARMAIFGCAFAIAVLYTYSLITNTALIALDVVNYPEPEDDSSSDSLEMETGNFIDSSVTSESDLRHRRRLPWFYV